MINMQSFELLLKHFAFCGVEKSPKSDPFSVKNFTVLFLICVNVSSIAILLKDDWTENKNAIS